MVIEVVGISRTAKSRELTDYWRPVKEPPTPDELSDAPIAPRHQSTASVPPETAVKRKRGRPPLPPELRKTKPRKKKADLAPPVMMDAEVAALPIQGLLEALAAVRAPSPEKTAVNMRLDAEVVAWLRRNGGSLSDRINSALRALMNLDLAVA